MVKNRERVRFCFIVFCFIASPDAAETGPGRTRGGAPGEGRNSLRPNVSRSNVSRRAPRRLPRLLRAEISLRPARYIPACPAEPATPCAATTFRQDTAFKQDYYAVKSHYVPTILPRLALPNPSRRAPRRISRDTASSKNTAFKKDYYALKSHGVPTITSRLALTDPQSRHLQDYCLRDYYAVKSHYVPPAPLLDCAASNEGKGMAAKSETALRGTAARPPAYTCRPRCRPRVRGAPGTSRPPLGAPTLEDNLRVSASLARSVLTGRRMRVLRAPGPLGRPAPRAAAPCVLSRNRAGPGIAQGKSGTLSVRSGNILCPVSLGAGGKSG